MSKNIQCEWNVLIGWQVNVVFSYVMTDLTVVQKLTVVTVVERFSIEININSF